MPNGIDFLLTKEGIRGSLQFFTSTSSTTELAAPDLIQCGSSDSPASWIDNRISMPYTRPYEP